MVKEKLNSVRIYDKDGFRLRAACVCVKDNLEQEILLISGTGNKSKWVVPGGGLEPSEEVVEAAHREVLEEAGVSGIVSRTLGVFQNLRCKTRTSVFLLTVTNVRDDWLEKSLGRKRKWFSIREARNQLALYHADQRAYLDSLVPSNKLPDNENSFPATSPLSTPTEA